MQDATIATTGGYKLHGTDLHYAYGIFGRHYGYASGDIVLVVRDTTITTEGTSADGVLGLFSIPNRA